MVFQESLKGLFGLLVFNPSLLLFFLFSLNFVGVEGLLLFTQLGKRAVYLEGEFEVRDDVALTRNSRINETLGNIVTCSADR